MSSTSTQVKMYIIVNSDLGMTAGKKCAQVGHGVMHMMLKMQTSPTDDYLAWLNSAGAKIVLKASQETMEELVEIYSEKLHLFPVTDMGLTQIEQGSFTVLAFEPLSPDKVPQELKELKLL